MDDSELTRKAIEELMREMNGDEAARGAPLERKKNPIGKPNKRFLDRTLNSVMQHNNRAIVRTQVSSRRKLREMDDRDRRRANNAYFNGCYHRDRYNSPKTRESRSYSRSRSPKRSTTRKKHVKKKKLKRKQRKHNRSSSRSRSRTRSRSPRSSQRKEKVDLKLDVDITPPIDDNLLQSYFMQSNANAFAAMALAYTHMQGVIGYENVTDLTTIPPMQTGTLSEEKFSDLSLSSSSQELSTSEGNENEHSDEDGVLTINVSSSSEEEDRNKNDYLVSTNFHEKNDNSSSSGSCISVNSNDTEDAKQSAKVIDLSEDIHVLSSGNSDDEVEIISVQRVQGQREEVTSDPTENNNLHR